MNTVELFPGPIPYQTWFEIEDKRYLIDIKNNILLLFFPFLIYVLPMKCCEVQKKEWEKRQPKIKFKSYSGVAGLGLFTGSPFFMNLIEKMNIGINIPPLISIVFSIMVGFISMELLTARHKKVNEKVLKNIKIRIYPHDFNKEIRFIFLYSASLLVVAVLVCIVYENPGNVFWIWGLSLFTWIFCSCRAFILFGKVNVKFKKNTEKS